MSLNNINDPLLLQVMILQEEFKQMEGFTKNPVYEQKSVLPSLLRKYKNRVLIIVKSGCAIHCRYCFRRYFPYSDNKNDFINQIKVLEYIEKHVEINEVILSGGDPLIAKDDELDKLITLIEKITHITTLRIHTRLPVVIPSRVTDTLCNIFKKSRLNIVLVTHINHAKEIDDEFNNSMKKLRNINVILLNQSVLLKGINDDSKILAELSERLLSVGILPYYLHLLDKVEGSHHFFVEEYKAKEIMRDLMEKVSGYLVPRLVKEIFGKKSKIVIDLGLS